MSWYGPKYGTIVDCVAPSSKYGPEESKNTLAACNVFAESMGWRLRHPKDIFGDSDLYANNDETRARTTAQAILAKDSGIIWPFRGGYGANIIMPILAKLLPNRGVPEKLLIGYSDITPIHMLLINRYNWSTIHWDTIGMVGNQKTHPECVHIFKCIVNGTTKSLHYEVQALNDSAKKANSINGKIFGGNLTLLSCSAGTFWGHVPHGSILFIEDVDEGAARIDRTLHHIWQAGLMDHVRAVLFGEFLCNECNKQSNDTRENALIQKTIRFFTQKLSIPCFRLDRVGHLRYNRPLPFNTKAIIHKTNDGHNLLEVETGMRF